LVRYFHQFRAIGYVQLMILVVLFDWFEYLSFFAFKDQIYEIEEHLYLTNVQCWFGVIKVIRFNDSNEVCWFQVNRGVGIISNMNKLSLGCNDRVYEGCILKSRWFIISRVENPITLNRLGESDGYLPDRPWMDSNKLFY